MDVVKIIPVIYSNVLRGKGTKISPVRRVEQWRTLDGELLFERDPWLGETTGEQIRKPRRR